MFALRYCIVWAVYIFLGLSGLRAEGGSLAHLGGGGSSLTLGFSRRILIHGADLVQVSFICNC